MNQPVARAAGGTIHAVRTATEAIFRHAPLRTARAASGQTTAKASAALAGKALARARRLPAHSRDLDREWIARLQKLSRVA